MTESRYTVELTDEAEKALRKLDPSVQRRIALKIDELESNPRPAGTKALTGHHGKLRVRVGDYQVVYRVEDDRLLVLVITLGPRGSVYRNLG